MGYDFFSQDFFHDSLTSSTADSLAVATTIKTTYLDDFRAMLEARWRDRPGRYDLRGSLEQTPELLRVKFRSEIRPSWRRAKLSWTTDLSRQIRYRDSTKPGDEYFLGDSRVKLGYPVSGSFSLTGQLRTDFVSFDQSSDYVYSYHRWGGSLGVMQTFAGLSILSSELFFLHRSVADSSDLNYDSYGLSTTYLGELGETDLDVSARLERRNLQEIEGRGDYTRFDLDSRCRHVWSGRLETTEELQLELANFGDSETFSSDYTRLQSATLVGPIWDGLELGVGPAIDWLDEKGTEQLAAGDYLELGGKAKLDYQQAAGLFGSIEAVWARRNVKTEDEFQADYTVLRFSAIGDLEIGRRLSFDMLTSAEWDWYADRGQDNRVYLVSAGLVYSF